MADEISFQSTSNIKYLAHKKYIYLSVNLLRHILNNHTKPIKDIQHAYIFLLSVLI